MLALSSDSPLYTIKDSQTRRNVLAALVIGFLLGYVSFVVGAIFALEGMRALIQIILHRSTWIRYLRQDVPRLFRKTQQGNTKNWKIHQNQFTGEPDRITVSFDYQISLRNSQGTTQPNLVERNIDSQDGTYSLEVVRYLLQQIQEEEEEMKKLKHHGTETTNGFLYLARDPYIGFPLHYIENKRQELLFWAQYVDVGIAFFGLHIFFLAAFLHAKLSADSSEDFWNAMLQATLSPLLMTPYLVVQTRVNHQKRVQAWKDDPMLVTTEFESLSKYWNWMGSTIWQNIYRILFLLGVCTMFLCCGWTALVLGLGMVYCIVEWVDAEAPVQRETLQIFQRQAKPVSASVNKYWREPSRSLFFGITKYYVRISYLAPSGHAVTKDIQSKVMYEECVHHRSNSASIEVLVDPKFPLSGYPTLQFFWDFHHSWPLCYWHLTSFVTMWFYLITSCLALDVDLDYPPEELILPVAIIFTCPLLMLPHASFWRRKQHSQYLQRLYETGTVIDQAPPLLGHNSHVGTRQEEHDSHSIRSDGLSGGEDDSMSSSNSVESW
jgi:hypothetical protein